jgi:hypothetical protein
VCSYVAALELTKALSSETDYITLTALSNALKFLDLMLRHEEEFYESFRAHVRGILQTVYDQVSGAGLLRLLFRKKVIQLKKTFMIVKTFSFQIHAEGHII